MSDNLRPIQYLPKVAEQELVDENGCAKEPCSKIELLERAKAIYEKLGFTILWEDDDFYKMRMPNGWYVHDCPAFVNMYIKYSYLYDEKHRLRATIRCADFDTPYFDARATIQFHCRFTYSIEHMANVDSKYMDYKNSPLYSKAFNEDKIVFKSQPVMPTGDVDKDEIIYIRLKKLAKQYLQKHFPKYQDCTEYWG